jgi:tetratricopeptide (TPR) repeat protein
MSWLSTLRSGLRRKPSVGSTVQADNSAVAVGGDIRNSTVTVGLDANAVAKQLQITQRPLVDGLAGLAAQIAREKGIDPAPLRAVLARLGALNVADDEIPLRLSAMADEFIELRQSLETVTTKELSSTKREALVMLDTGDFSGAYAVLERGRLASRQQRNDAARDEAEFLSDQARIDELQLSYLAAAAKYGEASDVLRKSPNEAFKFLAKQANALQNQGEEFGDNRALSDSIEIWRQARDLRPFDIAPEDHRKAHNNLGSALFSLALRETDNVRLYEVAALNREVLARDTRQSAPTAWAAATANLASTLQVIGEREKRTDMILHSIELSREVLDVIDRNKEAEKWAAIQNSIGNAFKFIAEDRGNEQPLEESIAAYKEALAALNAETPRALRSLTLMNLAAGHTELGRFRNEASSLEQAIGLLDDVLQLVPKEANPMQWANVKLNSSSTLNSLGIVNNDITCFERAILANDDALNNL